MNSKPEFTIPPELKAELIRETMLNINRSLYEHGHITEECYHLAKERFLSDKDILGC